MLELLRGKLRLPDVRLAVLLKRGGKVWIRIFPDKPITQKPLEVRQGSGKGNVEYWVCFGATWPTCYLKLRELSVRMQKKLSAWQLQNFQSKQN